MSVFPQFLVIDKPAGISCNYFLGHLKRCYPSAKKMLPKLGHLGTLDPFASGLLVVGWGGATKLNNLFHQTMDKSYLATGYFGIKTSSGDKCGIIKSTSSVPPFSIQELKEKIELFNGCYFQAPHTVSASKFQGKPLYWWDQKGITIVKEKKMRLIKSFEFIAYQHPYIQFSVTVSSGTFVRSLFEDLCVALGVDGMLLELRRTQIGDFLDVNQLKKFIPYSKWNIKGEILSPEKVIPLPTHYLDQDQEVEAFKNGKVSGFFPGIKDKIPGSYYVATPNQLLGVIEIDIEEKCHYVANFVSNSSLPDKTLLQTASANNSLLE